MLQRWAREGRVLHRLFYIIVSIHSTLLCQFNTVVLKLVVNRSRTNAQGRKYHVVFMRYYDNIPPYMVLMFLSDLIVNWAPKFFSLGMRLISIYTVEHIISYHTTLSRYGTMSLYHASWPHRYEETFNKGGGT